MVEWFQVASAASAILAAVFWAWSACMYLPDGGDMTLAGETSPGGYMKRQSRRSALGAGFAAVSALTQAAALWLQISD